MDQETGCCPLCLLACRLIVEGFRSLVMGVPNMNSLVAVGCTASFMVSSCPAVSDSPRELCSAEALVAYDHQMKPNQREFYEVIGACPYSCQRRTYLLWS